MQCMVSYGLIQCMQRPLQQRGPLLQLPDMHQVLCVRQSVMLCSKLLNACVPESIDERALNVPEQPGNTLADQAALENAMLCVNAARALGCSMSSAAAEDIAAGKVRRCTVE